MFYFLVTVVLGYFFVKELWMRYKYDLHKIPTPPKIPFLGHALQLKRGTKNSAVNVWVQKQRAKLGYPKLMRLCLAGDTIIFVTDIELAQKVSLPKSNIQQRGGPMMRHIHKLLMGNDPTPSFFNILKTTPYVKVIRRSYAESFTTAGMRGIFEKQIEVLNKGMLYLKEWQHEDAIDIQEFFRRLMLGLADPLLELKTKIFPSSKVARKINQDFDDMIGEWTKIANEVVNRGEPDEKDISVAANFRRVQMPGTDEPLPFNLLRSELATAIIGGFDTMSHQLSWIFALLATNPSVVDKLLDELRVHDLYGDGAKEFEFEDLSELQYLTAVVKEGMRRIHTLVAAGARTAPQDLILGGYRIPKNTLFYICSNGSMNCEMEWEDHLAFKPERWLDGNLNIKEKYYAPFGLGERDCVGMKLAMLSMRVSIVYFVTKFSFELVGDTIESLLENSVSGFVLESGKGINIRMTPRKNK